MLCHRASLAFVGVLRNRLSVVFFLAIWFAATQHCALECLGLSATEVQAKASSGCCTGPGDACTKDGCNSVEMGSPKLDRDLKIAAPQFVACACQICLKAIAVPEPPAHDVVRLAFERSDPGSPTWHFVQRAALPARAPSSLLA